MFETYKKKPVPVKAVLLTKENLEQVKELVNGEEHYNHEGDFLRRVNPIGLFIKTSEGEMLAKIGDYIIEEPFDLKRKYYPCKPDIFILTYEKI